MRPSSSSTISPATRPLAWRARSVAIGLLLLWTALAGRLVQLCLWRGPDLRRLAQRQSSVHELVGARPGDIQDRHGRVLATSVAEQSLFVVPCNLIDSQALAQQVAPILGLDAEALLKHWTAHKSQQFLWVKRRLVPHEVAQIRGLKLPRAAWGFREEFRRYYPQATLAAHVIGLRDLEGVGQGGVEQSCDHALRGVDGYRELLRDARGRVLDINEATARPPRHGQDVALTLDCVLQSHVERSLDRVMRDWKPQAACAVVLDAQTSDVLAMASRPTFDPNHPEQVSPDAWKNRAICDIYEPGSTFKPFVVGWALQRGCINRDEVFDCEHGEWRMGKRVLHDHHPYGNLNVVDILVKSSNIGMAKIGVRLTNPELHAAAAAFGFGGPTGIELPGELPGLLRPLKQWNGYSTGSVPMGQEIATTPLQVAVAYGALCHQGRLVAPRLVRAAESLSGGGEGRVVSPAIDAGIADWIRTEALTAVVSRGTGKKARIPGYQVFGKTGTAQKIDPLTGQYSRERHMSSFVCGAPADHPRVLVLVCVDEASVGGEHFGGSVAAPAAGEILAKALEHLHVPPRSDVAERSSPDSTEID